MNIRKNQDTYESIKKYYINLDRRVDRKESIEAQVGQDFKRVSAVVAVDLTPEEIAKEFDIETSKRKYNIDLTKGQIACTLSHFKIYQEIAKDDSIKDNSFVLISEDDNKFTDHLPQKITQLLKFLSQPKFNSVNMVILRYHDFSTFVDFVPHDYILDYHRLDYYTNEDRKKHISCNVYGDAKAHKKSQYFSFEYDDSVSHDPEERLFTKTQNLIAVNCLMPYSSAFYLIRKSAVKSIVKKFKKPFWITDDFKSIVPTQSILLASPLLGVDNDKVSATDIQNDQAKQNSQTATVFTKYEYKCIHRLKNIPGIYPLIYSKYSINRGIGKLLLAALKLNKVDHREYYTLDKNK